MIKKLILLLLLIQIVFGKTITLSNIDNDKSIDVATGDDITVRLVGEIDKGIVWSWSVPNPSDSIVLNRSRGAQTPNGGAQAVFHAVEVGTTDITATEKCVPQNGYVCDQLVKEWKVTVTVA